MRPSFVGIGCYKAGSTWLRRLLESHPDVHLPDRDREIHFFDQNFERGEEWYRGFFPDRERREGEACGEITPFYVYRAKSLPRARAMESIERVILIVRDPIARAHSDYRWRARFDENPPTFDEMLESEPELFDYGCYAEHAAPWVEAFGPDRVLCLVLEHATADLPATKSKVAAFLGVDPAKFPDEVGRDVVNKGAIPKRRRLYKAAAAIFQWTRRHDLDWIFKPVKRSAAARRVFGLGQGAQLSPVSPETRARLADQYRPHNERLASLFGLDLSVWENDAGDGGVNG